MWYEKFVRAVPFAPQSSFNCCASRSILHHPLHTRITPPHIARTHFCTDIVVSLPPRWRTNILPSRPQRHPPKHPHHHQQEPLLKAPVNLVSVKAPPSPQHLSTSLVPSNFAKTPPNQSTILVETFPPTHPTSAMAVLSATNTQNGTTNQALQHGIVVQPMLRLLLTVQAPLHRSRFEEGG